MDEEKENTGKKSGKGKFLESDGISFRWITLSCQGTRITEPGTTLIQFILPFTIISWHNMPRQKQVARPIKCKNGWHTDHAQSEVLKSSHGMICLPLAPLLPQTMPAYSGTKRAPVEFFEASWNLSLDHPMHDFHWSQCSSILSIMLLLNVNLIFSCTTLSTWI